MIGFADHSRVEGPAVLPAALPLHASNRSLDFARDDRVLNDSSISRSKLFMPRFRIPFRSQIFPCWIVLCDQPILFRSIPPLQLLLAIDCVCYTVERFEPNQPMATVLLAEPFKYSVLVLPSSFVQVARHTCVQHPRNTRDHVHEVMTLLSHFYLYLTVIPTK